MPSEGGSVCSWLCSALSFTSGGRFAWPKCSGSPPGEDGMNERKPPRGSVFSRMSAKEDADREIRAHLALRADELEQAGFVLEAKSFVLEDSTDTLDWNIFDPDAAGRDTTSRFVHLYRRPPVTPETPRPDEE